MQPTDVGQPEETVPKRATTQVAKIRLKSGSVNRIREAKKKAEMLVSKEGNNPLFQYQFEMQNKEEES